MAGKAVELGAHNLHDGQIALGSDVQNFFNPIIHLDSVRDIQSGGGNLGAQRLNNRVTTRDNFGLVSLLGATNLWLAHSAAVSLPRATKFSGSSQFVHVNLALAGGVPVALRCLGRGALTFESLTALSARTDGLILTLLANRSGSSWLTGHEDSNVHPWGCLLS